MLETSYREHQAPSPISFATDAAQRLDMSVEAGKGMTPTASLPVHGSQPDLAADRNPERLLLSVQRNRTGLRVAILSCQQTLLHQVPHQ